MNAAAADQTVVARDQKQGQEVKPIDQERADRVSGAFQVAM